MLRKLMKNKKAQNTAEYAILISLVVAGIIAMQTYAQRALQARVRDAAIYLKNQTGDLGNTVQYEPYYLTTNYTIDRDENETTKLEGTTLNRKEVDTTRNRASGGFQEQDYNTALTGVQGNL
jgi:uncharacterized protein (UPF0333 family)